MLNNNSLIGPDLLLSYWIFTWSVIYIVALFFLNHNNKYVHFFIDNCNPILLIFFALFENIITLIIMMSHCVRVRILILFGMMMILFKMIPLYLLSFGKINHIPNLISILMFFIAYNIYLLMNGTNIFDIYAKSIKLVMEEKTPFLHFVQKMQLVESHR